MNKSLYSQQVSYFLITVCSCLSLSFAISDAKSDEKKPADPAAKKTAVKKPVDPEHAKKFAAGLKLFESDVRKILVDRCLTCHGGDVIEGDFDVASREDLLKGGSEGAAIVLGKSKQSRLLKLIDHKEQPFMPYEEDKLSKKEIDLLAKWIDLGAPYDKPLVEMKTAKRVDWTERKVTDDEKQWWAFQPLANTTLPNVKQQERVRNPIDRFILAKLEEQGLSLNKQVDRRRLVRRVYFDLIGLPPTPNEVEQFANDSSPKAYENLLDRLLENKHYGERWGRHWLDVARFAESHGFEQDYNRDYAYHFRDFVIQALNQDMPYDQFVRWQLAGDEFEPENPLALMATGFLGAGVFPTQITANEVERTRYDALDDMAATTGTAMLGLTIGCARCHDHKFDPIPQADYYRFISTFTTTVRSNVDLDLNPEIYKAAKAKFEKEHAPLQAALMKFEKEELPARFESWLKSGAVSQVANSRWVLLNPTQLKSAGKATLKKLADGSILATGTNAKFDTYTFVAKTNLQNIKSIRLEALADPSMPKGGPGRAGNGNFALTDFRVSAKPVSGSAKPKTVELKNARATFEQKGLPVKATIDSDKKSAWAVDPQFGKSHAAGFEVVGDVGYENGTILTFTLKFENNTGHNIGRARFSVTNSTEQLKLDSQPLSQEIIEALAKLREKKASLTAKQRTVLLNWYRITDPQWQKFNKPVQQHLLKEPKPKLTKVMITSEGVKAIRHHTQGADFFEQTHFLRRGECKHKVKPAEPSFLQVLMASPESASNWQEKPPAGWKTSYRRRSLANWITDSEHGAGHLLARVIVNRLWQHHFGRGIVTTPNDYGAQGEPPSHPLLLDWLAAELIRNDWRLKPMHKIMMTSAVYLQSNQFNAAKSKIDSENRLYWRRLPQRLEAEVIRDSMLAISGMLDRKMFGPGTLDESHTRRSIYFMIKRSKLIPMMQLFDSPEPLVSVGRRPSTTVAPQALMFMNNQNVRKYATSFGKQLVPKPGETIANSARQGYLQAVGREPDQVELADAIAFIKAQSDSYKSAKKPEPVALAFADFCQVLMSLNEFIYVE